MKGPEAAVKKRVQELLKRYNVYWHMPVQNGFGKPSLDFICCHEGYFFAIETKAGNKGPSERQKVTMADMRKAKGFVFLINESTGTGELEGYLEMLSVSQEHAAAWLTLEGSK